MRKIIICMFALFGYVWCEAQTYYYYKGEKINITVDSIKCTVIRLGNEVQMKQKNGGGDIRNCWSIENRFSVSSKMKSEKVASGILSIEPVIASSQTPVSHLFYVKLRAEEDTLFLKDFAEQHGCIIERQVAEMPQWYVLSTSLLSSGNSIEMSNCCFETGRVADVDPGFIFDMRPSCIDEPAWITGDLWNLQAINCCDAWELTKGKDSIVVAVLDTGIESNHVEFPRLLDGYDAMTGGEAVVYYNYDASHSKHSRYHGTTVAGIIAAAQNGQFISGVAPEITLLPISHNLQSSETISEELANGISWAWKFGAHVINNSWGDHAGLHYTSLHSALLEDAIRDALTKGRNGLGTVVTFASGNNYSIDYPAYANDSIICVGSINKSFQWFEGSGYGEKLDVVAPGEKLLGAVSWYEGSVYPDAYGTSFACPHVSGLAALMLSVNPLLDVNQLSAIIDTTCNKLNGYDYVDFFPYGSWNSKIGHGLIDVGRAVNAAEELLPTLKIYKIIRPGQRPHVPTAHVYIDVTGSGVPSGYELKWKILSPEFSYISNYEITQVDNNFYELLVEGIQNRTSIESFIVQADIVKPDGGFSARDIIGANPSHNPIYTMQLRVPEISTGFIVYRLNETIISNELTIKKVSMSSNSGRSMGESHCIVNIYSLENKVMTEEVGLDIGTNAISIDVSNLPKGNYIVNLVEDGKVVFTDKFLIKR